MRDRYRLPDGSLVEDVFTMDELVKFLEGNGVQFAWQVRGDPSEDDNPRAMVQTFREQEAASDLRDKSTWWSTSGGPAWDQLECVVSITPQEWLRRLPGYSEDRPRYQDLGNVVRSDGWEDYGKRILKLKQFPQTVYVVVCRYGYHVESDFGIASEEDSALNRYVSALYGFPAKDFDPEKEMPKVDLGVAGPFIIAEWFGLDRIDPFIEHARLRDGVIPEKPMPDDWMEDVMKDESDDGR